MNKIIEIITTLVKLFLNNSNNEKSSGSTFRSSTPESSDNSAKYNPDGSFYQKEYLYEEEVAHLTLGIGDMGYIEFDGNKFKLDKGYWSDWGKGQYALTFSGNNDATLARFVIDGLSAGATPEGVYKDKANGGNMNDVELSPDYNGVGLQAVTPYCLEVKKSDDEYEIIFTGKAYINYRHREEKEIKEVKVYCKGTLEIEEYKG